MEKYSRRLWRSFKKSQPYKTQHFKATKKFLIYEDLKENKAYYLTLRIYSVDDSELDAIKSKENLTTFDKFFIEESGGHKT